jgi:hypothetical protein
MLRGTVAKLGPKRAALLAAGLIAALALVPILLLTTSGAGKPKPSATIASTPSTTSTPTPSAPVAKHRAKAPAHHRAARHPTAVKHPHHQAKPTSTKTTTHTTAARSSSTPKSTPASSTISFDLLGRSGDATSGVCGAHRHYRTYQPGEVIGFSGRVKPIPSAIWKVKVKIEVCRGGVFTDYVKLEPVTNKHGGTFSGSLPAPAAGFYRARAELYVNDIIVTKNSDEHFEVR